MRPQPDATHADRTNGSGRRRVDTGGLPSREELGRLLAEAHRRFADTDDGACSTVYPALREADPGLFGLALVGAHGAVLTEGDARRRFALMSVAKPFVFALAAEARGIEAVRDTIGVNATGMPFNSVAAVERSPAGRTNPMVNSGALVTTSLADGADPEAQWAWLLDGLSRFAGRPLDLGESILASARATNHRNRAIAAMLTSLGALDGDPAVVTDLYTRQSCLDVDAVDLATMGATLADGGVNPVTGERVVHLEVARAALVMMTVAGLYETSGDWLLDVGIPGKSGISGGVLTVSPGKGALGAYSPPLDPFGNSVRGQLAAAFLARELGLDIFASQPVPGG
jgi:glutaminase